MVDLLGFTTLLMITLIPVNGFILLAIRRERIHNRRLLMQLWRYGYGRRK